MSLTPLSDRPKASLKETKETKPSGSSNRALGGLNDQISLRKQKHKSTFFFVQRVASPAIFLLSMK